MIESTNQSEETPALSAYLPSSSDYREPAPAIDISESKISFMSFSVSSAETASARSKNAPGIINDIASNSDNKAVTALPDFFII